MFTNCTRGLAPPIPIWVSYGGLSQVYGRVGRQPRCSKDVLCTGVHKGRYWRAEIGTDKPERDNGPKYLSLARRVTKVRVAPGKWRRQPRMTL